VFVTASLRILLTLTGFRYKLWWEYQRAPKMTCHFLREVLYIITEKFHLIIETISHKDFCAT